MKTHFWSLLPLAAIVLLGSTAAHADPQVDPRAECNMHLIVELTPDVPDSHDAGFLSSLLNDHPEYQLSWVKKVDMSFVALDLNGPGPLDRCEEVVETMRRDGRVLSVRAEPDEVESVSVAAAREPSKEDSPRVGLSPYGFGAIYWAAHHPSQAWRIILPVEPTDTEAAR